MSRPLQKRKKGAMNATTRNASTLDTIREDEAATLSSTLQDPSAIRGSNTFQKTPSRSRRRRQHQAKRVPAGTQASDVKDVFQALWRAINQHQHQHTKSNLMYHIGQLERAMDGGFMDMIGDELAIIELILDRAVDPPPLRLTVVPPFMAILHAGPMQIIRDVKAIGKKMSRNSNVDMLTGSDSSMDYSSAGTKSSRSDASNVTMDEV